MNGENTSKKQDNRELNFMLPPLLSLLPPQIDCCDIPFGWIQLHTKVESEKIHIHHIDAHDKAHAPNVFYRSGNFVL